MLREVFPVDSTTTPVAPVSLSSCRTINKQVINLKVVRASCKVQGGRNTSTRKNYTLTVLTEMLREVFPVDSTTTPVAPVSLSSYRTIFLSLKVVRAPGKVQC